MQIFSQCHLLIRVSCSSTGPTLDNSLSITSDSGIGCVRSAACTFVYLFVQFFHHKPCVYLGCGYSLAAKPCGKVRVFMLDSVLDSDRSLVRHCGSDWTAEGL